MKDLRSTKRVGFGLYFKLLLFFSFFKRTQPCLAYLHCMASPHTSIFPYPKYPACDWFPAAAAVAGHCRRTQLQQQQQQLQLSCAIHPYLLHPWSIYPSPGTARMTLAKRFCVFLRVISTGSVCLAPLLALLLRVISTVLAPGFLTILPQAGRSLCLPACCGQWPMQHEDSLLSLLVSSLIG